jgi:phosphoenolpyruvate-protein phosphotransferase (PTS system enzyme I)
MVLIRDGLAAAAGIATGPAHVLHWEIADVPHRVVEADEVEGEVARFHAAREWAKERIRELREQTEARLGRVEARIFDPQLLMLDDSEVVEGTERYIRDLRLAAGRAFAWRIMELRALWARIGSPMILDRLNDLDDLQIRLQHYLLGHTDPSDLAAVGSPVVVVTRNLTPTFVAQMDPAHVLGIAAEQGTRTSHWAILARSMGIPAVVGLGALNGMVSEGDEVILDGRVGRLIVGPDEADRLRYRERRIQIQMWEEEIAVIAAMETVTKDGQPFALRANLDLPVEAETARAHGAQGVGLFRTEFLVVGRNAMPDEEEQYEAYREVTEAFPTGCVVIRTFDLGGDKFPAFLHMPKEENPFLGWRAIRVCLDEPELFRTQLRALLRASAHGDLRIMLPLVNDVDEVRRARALLEDEAERLRRERIPYNSGVKLGILVETPAAALDAVELARHSDFFSIGTNDLVQYTLAVDRTNSRLTSLYDPFHPSVVRQLHQVARVARAAGLEVSVCGEMAANPLGAFLMLGLDISSLSVGWSSLPEIKKAILEMRVEDARVAARKALAAPTSREVVKCLEEGIGDAIDMEVFGRRTDGVPAEGTVRFPGS